MKKNIFHRFSLAILLILIVVTLAGCSSDPVHLEKYDEFDLTDVKDLDEIEDQQPTEGFSLDTEPTIKETNENDDEIDNIQIIKDPKTLFTCTEDIDCVLIQPDKCCACPLAINKYSRSKIPLVSLGRAPKCNDDYLCGECSSSNNLEVSCVENRCIAQETKDECPVYNPETTEKNIILTPDKIVSYPDPEIPKDSLFKNILIKTSCQPGTHFNAVYLKYNLKNAANTTFEIREEHEEEYRTLYEIEPLSEVEQTIAICDKCILTNVPIINLDKKYIFRIKTAFRKEISYSGNYIIDTNYNSEYIQREC